MTATMTDERRVWVGCLACYNAGRLNGEWLDPVDGAEWRCANTYHEEFWVMDHEGFGGWLDGECSPQAAADLSEALEHLEGEGADLAVAAEYGRAIGADMDDPEEVVRSMADHHFAVGDTVEDALMVFHEEVGDWKPGVGLPIDWAAVRRDFEAEGGFAVRDGDTVHLFHA